MIGVAALVPSQPAPGSGQIRAEFATFRNPQVWLAVATTVLGFGGVFASFTYIVPMMTEVAGFPASAMSGLLVLFGVGLVIGNLLGGKLADWNLVRSLYLTLGGLAVMLLAFTFTAQEQVPARITLFVLGGIGFATAPALQTRVLETAKAAPTLASAVNIGAFNLGNALAAWLGGVVITAGLGYQAPNWVGALMAAGALGLAVVATVVGRRTTPERARTAEPELV